MSEEPKETADDSGGQGELQTEVLLDEHHTRADIVMVAKAVRKAWDIPDAKRCGLVDRLLEIVEKREVAVMTKDGAQTIDGPADTNAIGAARVLVAMDSMNQTDYWNNDKNDRLDSGKATDRLAIVPQVTLRGVG